MFKKTEQGNLPNLVIIGAAKCGTTSLHYYLGLHPQIFMSREKEINFFNNGRNWNRGIDWYKGHFNKKAEIYGESSVGYTHPFSKGVPERMHSIIPEAKLIYLLRDPVERIISDHAHNYADGIEIRNIDDALADFETSTYIQRSKYFTQLQPFLDYYSKANIAIITTEDLMDNRQVTLSNLFRFLNVDEYFSSEKFIKIKHRTSEKREKNRFGLFMKRLSETNFAKIFPADFRRDIGRLIYTPFSKKLERPIINQRLREALIDYLKEDINHLREYTGGEFKNWSV
ncbi:MAG: sulfotransferase domain-containing protein [Deltaproteobacteria bacterium]|nr:sulfotransferase domain-containing protein [Deltaproteobacteria bacterium]